MTNLEILKRLQNLEAAERDVASSMDMPPEGTANWEYAETAALARSVILQQAQELADLRDELTAARLERDGMSADLRRLNTRCELFGWLAYPPDEAPREAVAGDIGWAE